MDKNTYQEEKLVPIYECREEQSTTEDTINIMSATQNRDPAVTITVEVGCGDGPYLLSKTNGVNERIVNIVNQGDCTVRIYTVNNSNNEITGSEVFIPPGTRLSSYNSSEKADRILFTCASGQSTCEFTFTIKY